jgi:hypothetical protein
MHDRRHFFVNIGVEDLDYRLGRAEHVSCVIMPLIDRSIGVRFRLL